ncbi:hypothetical protein [Pantoea sp. BAV 3049]|uniref:hypothetical protein n=1 Tax=Pantoea sp. BAV 3049 TaxID=2654188 RepID=UPI0018EF0225|nr:hypothetical protein [Pantoea sp. BAV 3049]
MKWRTASISLMTLTLLLIVGAMANTLYIPKPELNDLFNGNNNGNQDKLQFGYYDLLSKSSELYNPHYVIGKKSILWTLSSPDDNRLQIKVLMSLKKATSEGLLYDYKPVCITQQKNDLMIANIMGHLERNRIILNSISFPGGKVTTTTSGQIISHL